MKKSYNLASPHFVAYLWIGPLILCVFVFLISAFVSGISSELIITVFIIYVFMVLFSSFMARNVYVGYKITEMGIKNRYKTISWEEIDSYEIVRVRLFEYRGIPKAIDLPSFVCFGNVRTDRFLRLDPKQCVFFSLTRKNLEKMKQCCSEENAVVSDILEKYY